MLNKKLSHRVPFSIVLSGLLTIIGCSGTKIMTMTTENSEVMIFVAGSGKFTIDWGDGTTKNGTLLVFGKDTDIDDIYHTYICKSSRTITITSKNITHFACFESGLTSLDVSEISTLTWLFCDDNQLMCLDVSKNAALEYFGCSVNQLTSLDVSKNFALKDLACSNNQLTSLDVSKNTILTRLWCHDNQLDVNALNNLFKTLPNIANGYISIDDNHGTDSCDRSIATNKGWRFGVKK